MILTTPSRFPEMGGARVFCFVMSGVKITCNTIFNPRPQHLAKNGLKHTISGWKYWWMADQKLTPQKEGLLFRP